MLHNRRTEVDVGLKLDYEIGAAPGKALGVSHRRRAVEPVVRDQQFDTGSLGVALNALFDLNAETHIALQIGEAKNQGLAVFRRRFFHRLGNHRLQRFLGKHQAIIGRRVETVELAARRQGRNEQQTKDQRITGKGHSIFSRL